MKKTAGQLSIEFILLLAVSFALIAVFFSSFKLVFFSAVFALDVENAKGFVLELQKKHDYLSSFGDGSFVDAKANFLGEWVIFSKGGFLFLEVKSRDLKKSVLLKVFSSQKSIARITGEKSLLVRLSKSSGYVLIEQG